MIAGSCGTEIQSWAEAARDFVEEVARARAGGLAASVRSMTHCGTAGIVTFSMLGEVCPMSAWTKGIRRWQATKPRGTQEEVSQPVMARTPCDTATLGCRSRRPLL